MAASNKFKRLEVESHHQKRTPESEWIIVENTHEPIVSKELFQKANEVAFTGRSRG
ncbi:recombinase family protein [Pseudobutyrivibrio sp.]|uniref:recombinase family protein n=1 Tax=Pseudobutyrivibrio sp. TaxID=2014367 RepID=UPI002FE6CD9D